MASVCPQNRAYGSVHGSSRKTYPLTNIKPVRQLFVRTNHLSHLFNKPTVRIRSGDREGIRGTQRLLFENTAFAA